MKALVRKFVACVLVATIPSSHVVLADDREEVFVYDQSNVALFQEKNYDNFRYLPGDRIVFRAGTIHIKDAGRWGKIHYMLGTKEKPIIIEWEVGPNGELLTTLDGTGFDLYGDGSHARDLLGIEQGQYVIIRNLRFVNSWNSTGNAGGIRFVGGDNLVVDNCYFENTQNGVFTYGSKKVTIKNSHFKQAGYFDQSGGGHSVYLENEQVYFVGNHVENSQFHSFRTRASFTYMENNYIENGGNTEVSLFGWAQSAESNSNVVMIGNVIVKQPSQRADGLPGNKYQFIQIGERQSPFWLYAYNNTFILDQTVASDNGSDQKNSARLVMFSDATTNANAHVSIKNNVIYGSDKLANEGQQGTGEFSNNIFMSGSVIPSGWTGTGNLAITGATVFQNYTVNTGNSLTIDGLKLRDESILAPIPARELTFTDKSGTLQNLATGLYNETDFSYHFEKGMRQMRSKRSDRITRCNIKAVGFADSVPDSTCSYSSTIDPTPTPAGFTGFTIVGDSTIYRSLSDTPTGRWLEIANTQMRSVISPRSYNSPVRAWGSPAQIMGASSGGAYDTKRDRLYVWGGGNMDYGGNDLYAFDLNEPGWKLLKWPASPSQWSELIASGATRYFDGSPRARTTVDSIEYDPVTDQMCALGETGVYPNGWSGKNVDCYDPVTNSWRAKNDLSRAMPFSASAYDPASQMFYEFSAGSTPSLGRYDPRSDTWTHFAPQIMTVPNILSEGWFPYGSVGEIDPESRKLVLVNGSSVFTVDLPSTWSGSDYRPRTNYLSGTILFGGLGRSPGIVYDPVVKKFILWGGRRELGVLDPSDWSYSRVTAQADAAPLSAQVAGTYGRFRYSARYDAYILANSIDQNVWIYRPDRTATNHVGPVYTGTDSTIGGGDSTNSDSSSTSSGSTASGSTTSSGVTEPVANTQSGRVYRFDGRNFSSFSDLFFGNFASQPGDRFVFASGSYTLKNLTDRWPKINALSGSIDRPIIIEWEVGPNGELLTTIDGAGFNLGGVGSNARDLLDIEDGNYVVVRNIRFKNAAGDSGNSAGVRFVRGDNLVVDNCVFENDQNGVFAYGSKRLTIKRSLFDRSGYFSTSGGGHGVYLETEELYFVGNHMINSQFHNFRSRAGFTYMQGNYLENAANTEISLFGGATTSQANANFVMIGNVVIKKPSQRADGRPGNSSQFIQIGERTTPFSVYAYNNTFILDQTVASDNGASQKNDARLFMFSDTNTHNNAHSYIKNNVIYGSNRLADAAKQGASAEFTNNILMSGSVIPSNWTASGNLYVTGPEIFQNYTVNANNVLSLSGLYLKNPSALKPITVGQLTFVDKSGNEHYLSHGLLDTERHFSYAFDRPLSQMTTKQGVFVPRTTQKTVGYGEDTTPRAFTGFTVTGDTKVYRSPDELPSGQWLELDDTKMRDVTEPEFYEGAVRAIVGPSAVIDAWGGAALDTKRQRMYFFGGGHGDYAGNEVYDFDLHQMRWERLTDPSMPPSGVAMTGTGLRNYDDSLLSRHTYDMLEYDPITDQMCSLGQSAIYPSGYGGPQVDCFDPKTNAWNRKKDLVNLNFSYGHSLYDPVDEVFYAFSASNTSFGRYDPKTDTWTKYRFNLRDGYPDMNDSYFPLYYTAELDPIHRTMVLTDSVNMVIIPLPTLDTPAGTNLNPIRIDKIFGTVQNAYTGTTAYPGIIYDPIDRRFVSWHSGPNLYYYDPATKTASYETISGATTPIVLESKGVYGRFRYSARYDMYILVAWFDSNVFVYKPKRTAQSNPSSWQENQNDDYTAPASSGGGGGGGGWGGGSIGNISNGYSNTPIATLKKPAPAIDTTTNAPQVVPQKIARKNYALTPDQKKRIDETVAQSTKWARSNSMRLRSIKQIIAALEVQKTGSSGESEIMLNLAIKYIQRYLSK